MQAINLNLIVALPLKNVWGRMHWSAKRKLMETLGWLIKIEMITKQVDTSRFPFKKCNINIVRYSAGDPDADAIEVKPLLDCLIVCTKVNPHGLGIILDDNRKVIENLNIDAGKCGMKQSHTTIEIREY